MSNFRLIMSLAALSLCIGQTAVAKEKADSNFSEYGIYGGLSPFGGSLSFAYNANSKTSWLVSIGGAPELLELNLKIDNKTYKTKGKSAWTGFFINHRPLKAEWFRLVAGIGFGHIENNLKQGENHYRVKYTENPVGYVGIGFGNDTKKGFKVGFDLGLLYTGGATVESVKSDGTAVEDIRDYWLFGTVLLNFQLTMGYNF